MALAKLRDQKGQLFRRRNNVCFRGFDGHSETNSPFDDFLGQVHGFQYVRTLAGAARACRTRTACNANHIQSQLQRLTFDSGEGNA